MGHADPGGKRGAWTRSDRSDQDKDDEPARRLSQAGIRILKGYTGSRTRSFNQHDVAPLQRPRRAWISLPNNRGDATLGSFHLTKLIRDMRTVGLGFAVLSAAMLPAHAADLLDLGSPFGESYRTMFADCDTHDISSGKPVTRLHRCTTNPSLFDHLSQVPATAGSPKAIVIRSKMAQDDDGSARSCSPAHGSTSQCQTTLMLKATAAHPCKVKRKPSECVPVDPDAVPYIVIPGGSSRVLGPSMGDYGMVILGDRQVPVIVADSGPSNKIGEGSTKLLSRLSKDGHVRTIGHGAISVMFPGSADPRTELSPETLPVVVERKATALYDAFRKANP